MASREKIKLAEGKTKIIWDVPGNSEVLIESKDTITAGDGARAHVIPGKGALATETTCNVFTLLGKEGIRTHYLRRINDTVFEARRVQMLHLELVARRRATGSYLKRNPSTPEGHRFELPCVEFFAKDDARHDPLVIFDLVGERKLHFDAQRPLGEGFLGDEKLEKPEAMARLIPKLTTLTRRVFCILERAWLAQDVALVDLKIECGADAETGQLLVADVIDNDSWRIWPHGDKAAMRDKQVYRDLPQVTHEAMARVLENYRWVAHATKKFDKW